MSQKFPCRPQPGQDCDPANRPQEPCAPSDPALIHFRPAEEFPTCLRGARRGTAAGPSGITNEHLCILLDEEADCTLLHGAAKRLARAHVPAPVVPAIRAGRIVALRKPNGRVRALVVGDVLRRLVVRTLAQEYASELQAACMPFQYGLSTRAGTEALVRLLRVATGMDPRATVLSDGAVHRRWWSFDHVSRHAMLAGLMHRPSLQPLLRATALCLRQHIHLAGRSGRHTRDSASPTVRDIYVVAALERIHELQDRCQRARREHEGTRARGRSGDVCVEVLLQQLDRDALLLGLRMRAQDESKPQVAAGGAGAAARHEKAGTVPSTPWKLGKP